MKTRANYIIKATVADTEYYLEYASKDVWTALEEFWHNDYEQTFGSMPDGSLFPLDVIRLDGGKRIYSYRCTFNAGVFHAYYDHGRITLGEFARTIWREKPKTPDNINLNIDEVALIGDALLYAIEQFDCKKLPYNKRVAETIKQEREKYVALNSKICAALQQLEAQLGSEK